MAEHPARIVRRKLDLQAALSGVGILVASVQ
jgi:hypothetical protein